MSTRSRRKTSLQRRPRSMTISTSSKRPLRSADTTVLRRSLQRKREGVSIKRAHQQFLAHRHPLVRRHPLAHRQPRVHHPRRPAPPARVAEPPSTKRSYRKSRLTLAFGSTSGRPTSTKATRTETSSGRPPLLGRPWMTTRPSQSRMTMKPLTSPRVPTGWWSYRWTCPHSGIAVPSRRCEDSPQASLNPAVVNSVSSSSASAARLLVGFPFFGVVGGYRSCQSCPAARWCRSARRNYHK